MCKMKFEIFTHFLIKLLTHITLLNYAMYMYNNILKPLSTIAWSEDIMARTKQVKKVKATTETTKTIMSLEQFQEMNAVLLETKDLSLYNSETLLQYHLWKLYIKMSQEPDLDMDEFLKDIPLNPESREKPPPSEKKKKTTTKADPTDELIIARARYTRACLMKYTMP